MPDLLDGMATLLAPRALFGEDPVTSVIRRVGRSIGQNLHTPADTPLSQPMFNDRPYVVWLSVSIVLLGAYKRLDPKTGRATPVRVWLDQHGVQLLQADRAAWATAPAAAVQPGRQSADQDDDQKNEKDRARYAGVR